MNRVSERMAMRKYRFVLCWLTWLFSLPVFGQQALEFPDDILKFRNELDADYRNPESSPLGKDKAKTFSGHRFFAPDLQYKILAKAERLQHPEVFKMRTSGERRPEYRKLYKLTFTLRDTSCVLYAYQHVELSKKEEYRNALFLPFTDKSNGFETYGGGRYMDLEIPEGDQLILDFNKSYNPYCAYSTGYSCPVPPAENALPLNIRAGIMAPEGH